MPSLRAALTRRFGVDARALAALRVALAVLLIVDLGRRTRSLVAFHTDAGALPRSVVAADYPHLSALSVHALSGAPAFQLGLFALAALAALALLVGYRTRLATLVSLVLLVSVHARAPVLLNGGDTLLRRLLFWGLFLPLGARWSLDATADSRADPLAADWSSWPERSGWVVNAATAALLLQVVAVYTVNAAFKHRSAVWGTGDALRYVFRLDQYTWLLGEHLPGHPHLLGALGTVWMAMLAGSSLLVLATGVRRALVVAAFAAAHVGMALTMQLYLFPFVSLAALLPFLPSPVWDRVERRLGALVAIARRAATRSPDRRLPAPGLPFTSAFRGRLLAGFVAVVLLAAMAWNAAALGLVAAPNDAVGEHSWRMFAGPPTTDVSVTVNGTTTDGRAVDPLRGGALEPADGDRPYPSERWRRYFLVHWRTGEPYDGLGSYLCTHWNRIHGTGLRDIRVTVTETRIVLDGPDPSRATRALAHDCGS